MGAGKDAVVAFGGIAKAAGKIKDAKKRAKTTGRVQKNCPGETSRRLHYIPEKMQQKLKMQQQTMIK
jgi:hypothetical protein